MNDSSFLSCIRVRCRSKRFAEALQVFLNVLIGRSDAFSYAELLLIADGAELTLYWMGDEQPDVRGCLCAISSAEELDVCLNLCSDADCATDALDDLIAPLADGAFSDCVRVCALIRSGDEARVLLSGMLGGAFHHGAVSFLDGMNGVPETTCWNSLSHTADFSFPESARDDAWDLSDLLEERIDEIDLDFSHDDGTLVIHSVQLPDADAVESYRAALEQFASIAEDAHITGALTPESENAFALLRFVLTDGRVTVQTAVAEI